MLYNAVGRVLCNKQDGRSYATAFREMFSFVTERFFDFHHGRSLEVILVDFDDVEAKGFKEALGADVAERVLRGCQVHWTCSLQRVCKLATKTRQEADIFLTLGRKIPYLEKGDDLKKTISYFVRQGKHFRGQGFSQ